MKKKYLILFIIIISCKLFSQKTEWLVEKECECYSKFVTEVNENNTTKFELKKCIEEDIIGLNNSLIKEIKREFYEKQKDSTLTFNINNYINQQLFLTCKAYKETNFIKDKGIDSFTSNFYNSKVKKKQFYGKYKLKIIKNDIEIILKLSNKEVEVIKIIAPPSTKNNQFKELMTGASCQLKWLSDYEFLILPKDDKTFIAGGIFKILNENQEGINAILYGGFGYTGNLNLMKIK